MSMRPELSSSKLEIDGRIATMTLLRDDVRNELTGTGLFAEITTVAAWLNTAPEISVLVLTGSGKSFSAGGNVKDMHARRGLFAGTPHQLQEGYRSGIQKMARALHELEIPALAAVNGAAIGAGFDLACMCDMRIAAQGATFGETFVNLGLIPGDGGAWFLQRLIGYQRAAELTFSGRVIHAREALELGLLIDVVPEPDLMARARDIASGIAAKPPQALRLAKRMMKSAQRMELADFLDLSALNQAICHTTEDYGEALSALIEKRPPTFGGS